MEKNPPKIRILEHWFSVSVTSVKQNRSVLHFVQLMAGLRQCGLLSYMFIILHISSVNKDYHNLIKVILYEVTCRCNRL